jgi:hypothetical protein
MFYFVILLAGAFLKEDLCSELFQEAVGLAEQLLDFIVFFELNEFEICLHVLLLESVESFLGFLVLYHLLFLFLNIVVGFRLIGNFFPIFLLLAMPLQKLFLVHSQMLHELFVFDLLSSFVVALHLVLQFFHTVTLASVFQLLFSSEVMPIKQLFFEQSL